MSNGNPQVEEGYTRIANELYEAIIQTQMTVGSRKVLDVIIRHTYGYNLTSKAIPAKVFVDMTRIKRPNIYRALRELSKAKIIFIENGVYKVNKSYLEWSECIRTDTGVSTEIHKEPRKKKEKQIDAVAIEHFEKLWSRYPKKLAKREAFRHYLARIKTEEDRLKIEKALDNFLGSRHGGGASDIKYVWNGGRWFLNWEDWYELPVTDEVVIPPEYRGVLAFKEEKQYSRYKR